jgi:cytochrome c-type biogenesis protein CcmH/NrfG
VTETTEAASVVNARQVELEAERDFLLRSLDDLEAERATGGIDDESYRRLHEDYTARAAATIRVLRDGEDALPTPEPSSRRRRVLVVCGVVAFAVLAGVALAAALGARLPGQTSSGNAPASAPASLSSTQRRQQLQSEVAKNPLDVTSRILLAQFLEADNNAAGALAQYDAVTKIQPTNADAEAQAGRLLEVTAQAAAANQAPALVADARARLDHAVELDPQLADAHFFRALVLANEYQDFAGAQNDLQHYLVLAPNGQFVGQAEQLLTQVSNALTGPPATTPTTKPGKATK